MFNSCRIFVFLVVLSVVGILATNWLLESAQRSVKLVEPNVQLQTAVNFSDWSQGSCYGLAQQTPEPYTPEYFHTGGRVDTSGPVWAFYQHHGNISWEDMESANRSTKQYLTRYKILDGKLYYREADVSHFHPRDIALREGLQMALALFSIPDVDFYFNSGDAPRFPGGPILQCCSNNVTGEMYDGFNMPFQLLFRSSLGPSQMKVLTRCFEERYPADKRIGKVVWRGSYRTSMGVEDPALKHPRGKAVGALSKYPGIADCGFTGFPTGCIGLPGWKSSNGGCPDPLENMDMEEYNKYAFVMDIDGTGWSGRAPRLVVRNTPIIKQVSRYPDYLSQHFKKAGLIEFFDSDASNVVERVKSIISMRDNAPLNYHQKKMKLMQEFSRTHLTHYGIARATAYALTVYADKITWTPRMENGFSEAHVESFVNPAFPKEFLERLLKKNKKI